MILDSVLQFSDYQDLSGCTSSAVTLATNVIDLGAVDTGKDAFGNDEPWNLGSITWFVNLSEALTGACLTYAELVTGSSLSTGAISSNVTIARFEFAATAAVGTKRSMIVQYEGIGRYLGVEYSTSTASLTTGHVDSGLILGYNDSSKAVKF